MLRIVNLAQWHLKKLAEGLVLKSEKVKEGKTDGSQVQMLQGYLYKNYIFHGQSKHWSLAVPAQCFKGKVVYLCLKTLSTQNVQNCASMERSRSLPFNYELT